MKDPLNRDETPYDILSISAGATDREIEEAFRQALVRRAASPAQLQRARTTLRNPEQRALLDLFEYDPSVLDRLTPNPLATSAALSEDNRAATAAAWERDLKRGFPDVCIAHALAVLWYWQAEVATADDGIAAWEAAIIFWSMVAASAEFWGPRQVPADTQTRVVERLGRRLHDATQACRNRRGEDFAKGYHRLELTLQTETRAAREMASAGLRTRHGRIACGPKGLERLGLLETVRAQIDGALRQQPGDPALGALKRSLSPLATARLLIEQGSPEAVLELLGAREDNEARRLRGEALALLGRQKASIGLFSEALDSWEEALTSGCLDDSAVLRREVVDACHRRALTLQNQSPNEAVELIERALKLADDSKLRLTLAEVLTARGVRRINESQEGVDLSDPTHRARVTTALRDGVRDFDRAIELGSVRARAHIETAQQMLAQLEDPVAAMLAAFARQQAAAPPARQDQPAPLRAAVPHRPAAVARLPRPAAQPSRWPLWAALGSFPGAAVIITGLWRLIEGKDFLLPKAYAPLRALWGQGGASHLLLAATLLAPILLLVAVRFVRVALTVEPRPSPAAIYISVLWTAVGGAHVLDELWVALRGSHLLPASPLGGLVERFLGNGVEKALALLLIAALPLAIRCFGVIRRKKGAASTLVTYVGIWWLLFGVLAIADGYRHVATRMQVQPLGPVSGLAAMLFALGDEGKAALFGMVGLPILLWYGLGIGRVRE